MSDELRSDAKISARVCAMRHDFIYLAANRGNDKSAFMPGTFGISQGRRSKFEMTRFYSPRNLTRTQKLLGRKAPDVSLENIVPRLPVFRMGVDPPVIRLARLQITWQSKYVLVPVEGHPIGIVVFAGRIHLSVGLPEVEVVLLCLI